MDERLIEHVIKAKDGNQEALHLLFDEYKDSVYCFLTSYIHNNSDIEDVCQETFISAFKSIKTIENPSKFKSWLFTIAYRRAMDFHRGSISANRKTAVNSVAELDDVPEDNDEFIPSKMLESEETRKYIADLVMKLPEEQKTAVLLHYYQQISIPDIAEMLECSEGTIKSRLYYARQSIKADIEKKQKKGYKIIAVAPFPVLTQILHKQEKKMPKKTIKKVWNGVQASLPSATPTTPTANMINISGIAIPTKAVVIIAGVLLAVAVAVIILLAQNDETRSANPNESIEIQIPNGNESNADKQSSSHDTPESDKAINLDPQTKAEYASLYYRYVQEVLLNRIIPSGPNFVQDIFMDAEIVDFNGDGEYELIYYFRSEGERTHITMCVDTKDMILHYFDNSITVKQNPFEEMNFGSSAKDDFYLSEYNGKPCLVRSVTSFAYKQIRWVADNNTVKETVVRENANPNSHDENFHMFEGAVGSYNDSNLSGDEFEPYRSAEATRLYYDTDTATSDWGAQADINSRCTFTATKGERLKAYFE